MSLPMQPPPALPGFETFTPLWQPQWQCFVVKIKPGEFYVAPPGIAISTVLGSCIAACIRDRDTGLGGMNHFMLPEDEGGHARLSSASYGAFAMEQLVNSLLKLGCRHEALEVKLSGGANLFAHQQPIGDLNARFACDYVHQEQLRLLAQDLGGNEARRVMYFPQQGRMLVRRMPLDDGLVAQEQRYRRDARGSLQQQDVELF